MSCGAGVCVTFRAMAPLRGSQCCLNSSFSLSLDTDDFLRLGTQTSRRHTHFLSRDLVLTGAPR